MRFPISGPIPRIDKEVAIIGEGDSDRAFFEYLCLERNIEGFFYDNADGIDDFARAIRGLLGRSGGDKLKGLIIVADSDEQYDKNLNSVIRQVKDCDLPAPNQA